MNQNDYKQMFVLTCSYDKFGILKDYSVSIMFDIKKPDDRLIELKSKRYKGWFYYTDQRALHRDLQIDCYNSNNNQVATLFTKTKEKNYD